MWLWYFSNKPPKDAYKEAFAQSLHSYRILRSLLLFWRKDFEIHGRDLGDGRRRKGTLFISNIVVVMLTHSYLVIKDWQNISENANCCEENNWEIISGNFSFNQTNGKKLSLSWAPKCEMWKEGNKKSAIKRNHQRRRFIKVLSRWQNLDFD